MGCNVCFLVLLHLVFLAGNALSQSTSISVALTPAQTVQNGLTSVRNIKKEFENELSEERTTRQQVESAFNGFQANFFKLLDNSVFKLEEAKADSIITTVQTINTPICTAGFRNVITGIKNNEARKEFEFCEAEIQAEINQVKQILASSQTEINTALTQAEITIRACEGSSQFNLTQLNSCISRASNNLQNSADRLLANLAGRKSEKVVEMLAKCADRTVATVQKSLNSNYDTLVQCLNALNNSVSLQLAKQITSTYKLNLTTNLTSEAITANQNIKANASITLDKLAAVRAQLDEAIDKRNRDVATLKIVVTSNSLVANYQAALINTSLALGSISGARPCLNQAQNRLQNAINTKADSLKKCLNDIKLTTSLGEVDKLRKSIVDRRNNEGPVASIKCLNSGSLLQSASVQCSAQADAALVTFLMVSDIQLNATSQTIDLIESSVAACESDIPSNLNASLTGNTVLLRSCLFSRGINYALPGL